jgi:hypothetical protein
VCVVGSRIRLTVTDVVDEQQAKLPQTVDNKTPQLLVTAAATRKHNGRPVFCTNNLDVVAGVDVHGSYLGRCRTRTTSTGYGRLPLRRVTVARADEHSRLDQPQKRLLFRLFSSPCTSVHSPGA